MSSVMFTEEAQAALEAAIADARARHNTYADVEHMLLGLLGIQNDPLARLLTTEQRTTLRSAVENNLGQIRPEPLDQIDGLANDLRAVMLRAGTEAEGMGHRVVNGGHLLIALMEHDTPVQQWLLEAGLVNPADARQTVAQHSPKARDAGRVVEISPKQKARHERPPEENTNPAVMTFIYIGIA
ncbi:MAG: Clp protease N-terminal domain-containing protein, partial [Anaerolineales bacterium]